MALSHLQVQLFKALLIMYDTKSFNFRLESLHTVLENFFITHPGIEFNSKKRISLTIIKSLAKPDNLRFS